MATKRTSKPSDAKTSEAWGEHEHVSPPVQMQAQKLLDEAGSPDLAKQAINAASAVSPATAGSAHDQFAQQLGFHSYLSLFEASTPAGSAEGRQWFITALKQDRWILWNDADLVAAGDYPTRDAAERGIPTAPRG
jgi:hypothetical protein